ncbi:MAG: hypothetical protein U0003_01150 [Vampirovibrionales bacterium]
MSQHASRPATHFSKNDRFKATAQQVELSKQVAEQAKQFVQKHQSHIPALLKAIQVCNTPVVVVTGVQAAAVHMGLMALGLSVGFIAPNTHSNYQQLQQLLTRHCGQQIGSQPQWQHGVFVLVPGLLHIHYLAHQIHHWMSYRAGLAGYGWDQQRAFHEFQNRYKGVLSPAVEKRGLSYLKLLQQPLQREMDAIAFVKTFCEEVLAPEFEGERRKQTGSAFG